MEHPSMSLSFMSVDFDLEEVITKFRKPEASAPFDPPAGSEVAHRLNLKESLAASKHDEGDTMDDKEKSDSDADA